VDLSIIIAHCARSLVIHEGHRIELFPRCIESLNEAKRASGVTAELVVADWPRVADGLPLRRWLLQRSEYPVRLVNMRGPFSKGRGCNTAARLAQCERLFFLDADMLVPAEVISRGAGYLRSGKAWFPGYLHQRGLGSTNFKPPKVPGTGCAFMLCHQIRDYGWWPEQTHWGGFDRPVSRWFEAQGLVAEPIEGRAPVPGFVHQWHPKFIGWPDSPAARAAAAAVAPALPAADAAPHEPAAAAPAATVEG
jgi:hypothetical protein